MIEDNKMEDRILPENINNEWTYSYVNLKTNQFSQIDYSNKSQDKCRYFSGQ